MHRSVHLVLVKFHLKVILYDSIWINSGFFILTESLLLRIAFPSVVPSPDYLFDLACPDIKFFGYPFLSFEHLQRISLCCLLIDDAALLSHEIYQFILVVYSY